MKAIKIMNNLYAEFVAKHPRFSDIQFVLPTPKVQYLKQMARASHQTMALCNAGRNDYHFLNLCNNDFKYLLKERVTVEEFFNSIYIKDLKHFLKAWETTFGFINELDTDEILNYSLVFECRIQNSEKKYCRVIFKYALVVEDEGERRGQPILFLKAVNGCKNEEPAKGIYILDMANQKFAFTTKGHSISKREMDIIKLGQQGFTCKDIAEKLGVKTATVNNHRCNVLRKLSVRNNSFAVMYLHFMGVM